MNKFGALIKEARKSDKKTGKLENQKTSDPGPDVNLSIKVPLRLRQHWAAEAKRQGATLTAAITEALTKRFGEP